MSASRLRDDLALAPELFDAEFHDVPGLQEYRVRLDAHADAGRCSGGDHVAGMQAHELAEVADQEGRLEDHRAGRAVLAARAIHVEPHREIRRVADLVRRDQPWTERTEGVAALALVPLPTTLELEGALGK